MNIEHLQKDNSKEITIKERPKEIEIGDNSKNLSRKERKAKDRRARQKSKKKSQPKKQIYGKVSNRLKKKLNNVDNHHFDEVLNIIKKKNLHKAKIINNKKAIPAECYSCKNCIRAIGFCTVFEFPTKSLKNNITKCSFKNPMNYE